MCADLFRLVEKSPGISLLTVESVIDSFEGFIHRQIKCVLIRYSIFISGGKSYANVNKKFSTDLAFVYSIKREI